MDNWKKLLVLINSSIREVMGVITNEGCPFVVVVDEENNLLGTVTDGDIRRGLLRGVDLSDSVTDIMNKNPKFFTEDTDDSEIKAKLIEFEIHHAPIVNANKQVISVKVFNDLNMRGDRENKVVIMAGGLGSRLGELTEKFPKPMLKVGGKPILETIISNFTGSGFNNIALSVNYLGEVIEDYFKDGSNFNSKIEYLREPKRLGTAGSLTLLEDRGNEPLVVMNGDILTNVNFEELLNFHKENKNDVTVCVREYNYNIPYGVVKINNDKILKIEEKPVASYFVNAGIYIINPEVINHIPHDEFFDMTMLLDVLIEKKSNVGAFPLHEYWMDIGQKDDFFQAHDDYGDIFR